MMSSSNHKISMEGLLQISSRDRL